ncbi:MAG: hypothetical protein ACE3JK_17495 [Sporolactobacillus sp.]
MNIRNKLTITPVRMTNSPFNINNNRVKLNDDLACFNNSPTEGLAEHKKSADTAGFLNTFVE